MLATPLVLTWPDRTAYRHEIAQEQRLGWAAWVQGEWTALEQWVRHASPRAVEQLWLDLVAREPPDSLGSLAGLLRAAVHAGRQRAEAWADLAKTGQTQTLAESLLTAPPDAYQADLALRAALEHGHPACAQLLWDLADHHDPVSTTADALKSTTRNPDHDFFTLLMVKALPETLSMRAWVTLAQAACVGGQCAVLEHIAQHLNQHNLLERQAQTLLDHAARAHQGACARWLMSRAPVRIAQLLGELIHQGYLTEADTLLWAAPPVTRRDLLTQHAAMAAHFPQAWQQQRADEAQERHEHGMTRVEALPTRSRARL